MPGRFRSFGLLMAYIPAVLVSGIGKEETVAQAGTGAEQSAERIQIRVFSCDWQGAPIGSARIIRIREFAPIEESVEQVLAAGLPVQNLRSLGDGSLPVGPAREDQREVLWMSDSVAVRVGRAAEDDPQSGLRQVTATFQDFRSSRNYVETMPFIDNYMTIALYQRGGTQRALGILLFPRSESPGEAYSISFITERFTIYSQDTHYVEPQGFGQPSVFHRVKVVIPEPDTGKPQYILRAEEVHYSKEADELLGKKAVLLDGADNTLAQGEQILITFTDGKVEYELKD